MRRFCAVVHRYLSPWYRPHHNSRLNPRKILHSPDSSSALHLIRFSGATKVCPQTVSRSVQPFLYSWTMYTHLQHRPRRRLPCGNSGDWPWRKTPHRPPPRGELDPSYDVKLVFFVQKITLVLRKINKNCCHQRCRFYRAMLCIRGTSHGPVSVCLSVCLCLSVTSRSSTKTAKHTITQTTPHDSTGTLVFWCQRSPRNSTGVTPYEGAECRWGGSKSATFNE